MHTDQIVVRGSMNATADATFDKTMQNLLARADATVQANAQPAQGGTITPINGAIHTRYSGRSGQLSFDQSDLRTPQSSISLNGTISDHASLQVRFNSNDLHELETIATAFRDTRIDACWGIWTRKSQRDGQWINPKPARRRTANGRWS